MLFRCHNVWEQNITFGSTLVGFFLRAWFLIYYINLFLSNKIYGRMCSNVICIYLRKRLK